MESKASGRHARMSRQDLLLRLRSAISKREEESLLRRVRTVTAVAGAHIVVDGKRLLNFSSNDYLGLAQHPALVEALALAASRSVISCVY